MIAQVRPAELSAWLMGARRTGAPVLLDVREPSELVVANVSASPVAQSCTLLTIPMSQLQARMQELDPAQPLACLCHHGGRSMQVANFLLAHGFSQVANVAGGIHAWSQELDPAVPTY